LLILLFQPDSGTISGENTLFYVLAGAVLADLALSERVTTTTTRMGAVAVEAVEGREPSDDLLRSTWSYVSGRPRGVQTVLAAMGPTLRQPILERLISRGDIRVENRKVLGLIATTALVDGGNGRRSALLADVRDAFVSEAEPTPRVAALATLIWGSGTLPQFDPEIPWRSSVIARAKELERGNWGAAAAGEAVTRTMTAIIVTNVIAATTVLPPH
jgi:Golgi phosphoprotein 3 (GPP34)